MAQLQRPTLSYMKGKLVSGDESTLHIGCEAATRGLNVFEGLDEYWQPGLPEGFFRKGQSGDWQNSLKPRQRYSIHETAGDLLTERGYAQNSWWFEHWHERYTLPLIANLQSRKRIKLTTLGAVRHPRSRLD